MLAIVCPGQGAQTPGFLSPWLELPGHRAALEALSEPSGTDLVAHGTTSDAQTVRDTAVAQPLIVAAGLACLAVLPDDDGRGSLAGSVAVTGGHSVGEVTAMVVAGVLTAEEAVALVRERGRVMAAAAAAAPTGMSAVVGGAADDVEAAIARSGAVAANRNGAGQVVAAGTLEQLAALAADPPARARVVPLAVAGAFHTEHMAPAVGALAEHAASLAPRDPAVPLLSNADGAVVTSGADALARVVRQVSSPVRWDLCQAALAELGVTGLVEVSPAGTLAGLAKRSLPGVEVVALRTPDDLPAARELVARHGAPATGAAPVASAAGAGR